MLSKEMKGKKLLLLGGVGAAADLSELTHRNGIFLGVAGYNPGVILNQIADAVHDVDALDVEAIVALCKSEHYEGIISNSSDLFSSYAARIAEQLGWYAPYTVEQLRMSTDKKYFKDICLRYGVPVPKEYFLGDTAEVSDIPYPVIVKPVDNSGSRGLSVCNTPEELQQGIAVAKKASRCGRYLIEEFISADEINVTYICQDGDIQLAAIHDRYFNTAQENCLKVPDMYIYPSRYTDVYLERYNDAVIAMLKDIGLKNGSLFLQACVRDNQVYFYEAGMRLNGCKTYQILEVENDYNTLEHLVLYALTGSMGKHSDFSPKFKRWYATWNLVGKPGGICQTFIGKQELESYPWVIKAATKFQEGGQIPLSSKGTLGQLVGRFHLYGDTKEQLLERIDTMQRLFHIQDPDGAEVLLTPHDVEDLRQKLNYEL